MPSRENRRNDEPPSPLREENSKVSQGVMNANSPARVLRIKPAPDRSLHREIIPFLSHASDHRRLVPLALEKSRISFDGRKGLAKIDTSKSCPFETFHLSRVLTLFRRWKFQRYFLELSFVNIRVRTRGKKRISVSPRRVSIGCANWSDLEGVEKMRDHHRSGLGNATRKKRVAKIYRHVGKYLVLNIGLN